MHGSEGGGTELNRSFLPLSMRFFRAGVISHSDRTFHVRSDFAPRSTRDRLWKAQGLMDLPDRRAAMRPVVSKAVAVPLPPPPIRSLPAGATQ